ncbi:MAG: mannose-1-phosphate guanylyltransferase/mannose-6-phosphate isomerase [Hyphomonadaceae bacterium]|nr:mannose-1-phosphate guanylyltransferase/mannose-6-phosphate isomerase [Hyphomonadaceae bacterium]
MKRILPAIMSGGSGERLWPESTEAHPKQFRALVGKRTLFQEAAARMSGRRQTKDLGELEFLPPLVLCHERHAELALAQLAELGIEPAALALEPEGRNTAAVGALAAALGRELAPDALVLLSPADHVITNVAAFHDTTARAAGVASERIVTFGVTPTRAETGYGYIERGQAIADGVYAIRQFHEKPEADVAERYAASGAHDWNSGMFLFDPDVLLGEFAAAAEIRDATLAALAGAQREGRTIRPPAALYRQIPKAPIDKAVMEKTAKGAVAPADFGWADLGSWAEIWRLSAQDAEANCFQGDAIALDARRNLVRSDGPRVALVGVDDLIVVVSGGTVLIGPRDRAQDVKKLVELARAKDAER